MNWAPIPFKVYPAWYSRMRAFPYGQRSMQSFDNHFGEHSRRLWDYANDRDHLKW